MLDEILTAFTDFLKYMPKNIALLSKSVSGYFKTKKKNLKKKFLMTTKGVKALVVRTTKKRTFF